MNDFHQFRMSTRTWSANSTSTELKHVYRFWEGRVTDDDDECVPSFSRSRNDIQNNAWWIAHRAKKSAASTQVGIALFWASTFSSVCWMRSWPRDMQFNREASSFKLMFYDFSFWKINSKTRRLLYFMCCAVEWSPLPPEKVKCNIFPLGYQAGILYRELRAPKAHVSLRIKHPAKDGFQLASDF